MKIWHDDIRPAPEGWEWVRTNAGAMYLLRKHGVLPSVEDSVTEINLDHDLGLDGFTEKQIKENPELLFGRGTSSETGYDLVCWMTDNNLVPDTVVIHSWNPDGARNMAARLNRAGYNCTITPYTIR